MTVDPAAPRDRASRPLDTAEAIVHTRTMAAPIRDTNASRTYVQDLRGNGHFLRCTWHPDRGAFVLSTWDGDVCNGTVRLDPLGAAQLIAALNAGVIDSIAAAPAPAEPPQVRRPRSVRWREALLARARSVVRRSPAEPAEPSAEVISLDDLRWWE